MAKGEVVLRVVFSNQDAIDSMDQAIKMLVDLQEDIPWKPELAEAIEMLRYACTSVDVVGDGDKSIDQCEDEGNIEVVEIEDDDDDDLDDLGWLDPSVN